MENDNIKNIAKDIHDKYMKDFNKWFNDCIIIPVHSNSIHIFKNYYKDNKESKEVSIVFKEPFINNNIINDDYYKTITNVSDKIKKI